jgi:hypothetical protein
MIDVLQSLLDDGLLKNIGSDEDFQNLRRAADDLSDSLLEDYGGLLRSMLAALDPDATEEDPSLERAEEKVKSHWTTFRNQFQTGAAFALRAVVLDALARAAEEELEAAGIIWYAGSTVVEYEEYDGIGEVIKRILNSSRNRVEKAAEDHWSFPSDPEIETIPNVKFDAYETDGMSIDKKNLAKSLQAAAVPQDTDGNNLGGNSRWPHDSNNARSREWGKQFAEHAADAIVKDIGVPNLEAISDLSEDLEDALRSHSHSIRNAVRKALKERFDQMRIRQLRLDLMWWMRTKYSPLLRRSYRGIESSPLLLTIMAFDLHQQVPEFTPQSVEYLLREYAYELHPGDEELSVEELLDGLSTDHVPSALTQELKSSNLVRDGRNTFASAASSVAVGTLSTEELNGSISSLLDKTIPAPDLVVQLFRAFQAERLASSS